MARSVIDLQANPETVRRLEEIIKRLKSNTTSEAFLVSLLQNHDEVTSCVIGLKKEITKIAERLAVIETKVSIFGSMGSKFGLMILGGILTMLFALATGLLKNILKII